MSESSIDAATVIDQRLARDGVTIDDEERTRLIELVPVVQEWVRKLSFAEVRYAEPALTHPVK